MSDFSFFQTEPMQVPTPTTQKSCVKRLDDIMDAYVSQEQKNSCAQNIYCDPMGDLRKSFNIESIKGYNEDSSTYLPLDQYYKNDFSQSQIDKPQSQSQIQLQSQAQQIQQEDIHIPKICGRGLETYIEKYDNKVTHQMTNEQLIELAIYLISGIFLIFMMEQILKIGTHMKL